MINQNVTRKAVLIGCPGLPDNYLPGVVTDIDNVMQFLLSEKGGAWYESAITILNDPTVRKIEHAIKRAVADYTLVYYAGHGLTNHYSQSVLCVGNDLLLDWKLLNASLRQLVVVDACREYIEPGISGLPPDFGIEYEYFEGSPARALFDKHIRMSPHGKLIVHGTQVGAVADEGNDGGVFTTALLHVSTRLKAANNLTYAPIDLVLKHVARKLARDGSHQIPCITYREGNLQMPFAIGIPSVDDSNATTIVLRKRNVPQHQPQRNVSNGLLGWGILGVVILLLAAD